MINIKTRLLLLTLFSLTAFFHSISQDTKIKDLYIDSLAQDFILLLEEDSIYNYIVYSETTFQDKGLAGETNCQSNKILYLLWQKGPEKYMKKFSYCFEYEYVEIDYNPIIFQMFKNDKYLINNNNFDLYYSKKKDLYNKQQSSSENKKTVYDIYARYYGQEIFMLTTLNESKEYDNVISAFQEFFRNNDKYLVQKRSYTIEKDFVEKHSSEKTIIKYNNLKSHKAVIDDSKKMNSEWNVRKKELFDEYGRKEAEILMLYKLKNTRYKDIYIDSLAEEYVEEIKNKGFSDYIIYSVIKKPQEDGSKTLYIIWPNDTSACIKKISSDIDYGQVNVDISQLREYILLWQGALLKYFNKNQYLERKNQYINSPYCVKYGNPLVDIQIHLDTTKIYYFAQSNWSKESDKLVEIIQKIIAQNEKSFIKKSKYLIPKNYIQKYVDDINKMEAYKSQLIKEWFHDSIPINEDSLKLKPRLVREAYYLYEYLMQQDTFITGHYFKRVSSNFWMTGIHTGTYKQKGTFLTYEEEENISKTYIGDFKPRPFKGYRMLYSNKKINDYFNTSYCKYGPLQVSMNFHRYMSGVRWPKPSFPGITSIYFSEDYTEAQVYYSTGYNYSVCMIRKEGMEWKLVEDKTILCID